jgi:hypothetical protein
MLGPSNEVKSSSAIFMAVKLHPHAKAHAMERGVIDAEDVATVEGGEPFPAKYGRAGFRRNFPFNEEWGGKHYPVKQIEAYAVKEAGDWIVVTVIARYF